MFDYLEKSLMRGWMFLSRDVNYTDYGGKWYRRVGDGLYHVIELVNMVDACSSDADYTYHVALQEVDADAQDADAVIADYGLADDTDVTDVMLVDYASGYGSYIGLADYSGNNYRLLLRQAKHDSSRIIADAGLHLQYLQRPVNRLGSTALEMSRGDFNSATIRGIAKQDKTARLVGKIHGLADDDMDAVESNAADFSLVHPCEYRDIVERTN